MRKKREISKENEEIFLGFSKLARAKNNALRNVRGNFEFLFLRHGGDEDDRIVRWSRHVFVFVPSSLFCKVQKRVYLWNEEKIEKTRSRFWQLIFCLVSYSSYRTYSGDKMNNE